MSSRPSQLCLIAEFTDGWTPLITICRMHVCRDSMLRRASSNNCTAAGQQLPRSQALMAALNVKLFGATFQKEVWAKGCCRNSTGLI